MEVAAGAECAEVVEVAGHEAAVISAAEVAAISAEAVALDRMLGVRPLSVDPQLPPARVLRQFARHPPVRASVRGPMWVAGTWEIVPTWAIKISAVEGISEKTVPQRDRIPAALTASEISPPLVPRRGLARGKASAPVRGSVRQVLRIDRV